mgnify:CR=1 FL=1
MPIAVSVLSSVTAGVIDEVGVNVHPVLLGSGVPLFRDPGARVPLELAESRVIDGGCVLSIYRVVARQATAKKGKKRKAASGRRDRPRRRPSTT